MILLWLYIDAQRLDQQPTITKKKMKLMPHPKIMISIVVTMLSVSLRSAEHKSISAYRAVMQERDEKTLYAQVQAVPVFQLDPQSYGQQEAQKMIYLDAWQELTEKITVSNEEVASYRAVKAHINPLYAHCADQFIRNLLSRQKWPTAQKFLESIRAKTSQCHAYVQGRALMGAKMRRLCKNQSRLPLPLHNQKLAGTIGQFLETFIYIYCSTEHLMPPKILKVPAHVFCSGPNYTIPGAALIETSRLDKAAYALIENEVTTPLTSCDLLYHHAFNGLLKNEQPEEVESYWTPSIIFTFLQKNMVGQIKAAVVCRYVSGAVISGYAPLSIMIRQGHILKKHQLNMPINCTLTLIEYVQRSLRLSTKQCIGFYCTWCARPLAKDLMPWEITYTTRDSINVPLGVCKGCNCTAVPLDSRYSDMLHSGNGTPRFLCKLLPKDDMEIL